MCQRQATTFLIFMSIEFRYMENKLCFERTVSRKFDETNQAPTLKTLIVIMSKCFFIFEKV